MPKYRVRDNITGREFVLEGETPPTEQELEEIFSQYRNEPPKRSLMDVAIPTALRVGGSIGGATIAGAVGSLVPAAGTAAGIAAGGAAGGALGELLAEAYEQRRGIRDEINPV